MTTNYQNENFEDREEFTYHIPNRWLTYITYAISGAITRVVVATITAMVIILVILGGLWLAYNYLPINVFYIIVAVVVVDMALGIILRAVLSRR